MLSWAAAIVARVIGLASGPYGPWLGGAALLVVAAIGVWHYTSAVADAAAAREQLAQLRADAARTQRALDVALRERRRAAAAAQEADRRAAAIRAELVELRRVLGSGGCEAALDLIRRRQETAR